MNSLPVYSLPYFQNDSFCLVMETSNNVINKFTRFSLMPSYPFNTFK